MISVIVPVYNSEKYINRCVDSIISQSYSEWELFLIDDGSTDKSLQIIREYAKRDKRINAIHQTNQGAGAARNKGLNFVSGDYVVFVDSDDYIDKEYFTLLSRHTEDVVFIDVNRRDYNGNIVAEERLSVLKGKSKDDILRGQMTGKILWGGVRKAARRSLISEKNIRYSSHKVGEEAIYSFSLLYYAKTFSFIDVPVYNYEVHSDSLSQVLNENPWGPVAIELRKKTKELSCYHKYANTLNCFIYTANIVSLSKIAKKYTANIFFKKARHITKRFENEIDYNYKVDFVHMDYKVKILFPFLKARAYWVIYLAEKIREVKEKR